VGLAVCVVEREDAVDTSELATDVGELAGEALTVLTEYTDMA